MKNRPTNDIVQEATRKHIDFIYENAKDEEIKTFTVAPTSTTLKEGQEAYYNNKLYRNINGTVYNWTVST